MSIEIVPLVQRPELEPHLWRAPLMEAWPTFMRQDPTADLFYDDARFARYREFAVLAFDERAPNDVLARGFAVPFCLGEAYDRPDLPDEGWDAVIRWADTDCLLGREPNVVSALEILIAPQVQGQGLAARMVSALRQRCQTLGFTDLFAPIRPTQKHLEPMTPMAEYAQRLRDDGLPLDAWLRVHVRSGATLVKVAPCSMTIANTLDAWRAWTGLPFDQDGPCLVPRALAPVHVDTRQNYAVYVEPNVWVHHRLAG